MENNLELKKEFEKKFLYPHSLEEWENNKYRPLSVYPQELWQFIEQAIVKARTEERARIVTIVKTSLDEYAKCEYDSSATNHNTLVRQNQAYGAYLILEKIYNAITADQPTQQSCEGCVSYELLCNNDDKRDDCKDYSHYQKRGEE